MSCGKLVFDTGPLSSFAVVAHLDLLEVVCAGHGSWPLSVQRELQAGARVQPALSDVLESAFLRGVFVSEDRDARVMAAGELGAGRVVSTPDLLARAVRMGLVRPDGAWEIYRAMLAAGRRLGHIRSDRFGR
jgi:hypothetical protein